MAALDAAFYAAGGASSLALALALWAVSQRRAASRLIRELTEALNERELGGEAAQASAEAFGSAVVMIEHTAEGAPEARLASGPDSLAACAVALGLVQDATAEHLLDALIRSDLDHARKLEALIERGEPCDFEARAASTSGGLRDAVVVEGRTSGALAWLRLSATVGGALPSAARFADFLDAQPSPAWISASSGRVLWANRAWLGAADAASVDEAQARGLAFDRSVEALAAEAAAAGERRDGLRWAPLGGQRRAFHVTAEPLEGGGAGAVALDVTETEDLREVLKRHVSAHDETLNRLADAVAIFGPDRRLSFHNIAFAELWGLEPAWLADAPTHGEVLDKLRQRRRLPEQGDYAGWKARELGYYEALEGGPDELWSLPDRRTLRVSRQPHPFGGLLILYSDITGELRLRAEYNALVQGQ